MGNLLLFVDCAVLAKVGSLDEYSIPPALPVYDLLINRLRRPDDVSHLP